MKVITTSNIGKAFSKQKGFLGELKVPVRGLQMVIPIAFRARYDNNIDSVDEEQLTEDLAAAIDSVTGQLAEEVEQALGAALRAGVWAWREGSRDIYDTGELERSVSVTATSDGISVSYSAPYANIVHNGGYIYPYGNKNARPVYLPPRPWVSSVLYGGGPVPQFDFDDFLKRNIQ